MAGFRDQLDKIDNLSLRERGILLGGGLVVMFMVWFNFFHEPLMKEKAALDRDIEEKRAGIETLTVQHDVLTSTKPRDPNAANRQRREDVLADLDHTRNAILQATSNLVAPGKMPELLRSVLARIDGLQLVKLEGLGKTPLIERTADEDAKAGPEVTTGEDTDAFDMAYKHGMKIVFEGDYFTTLDYIRKLETLEWRFFWDSIEFIVEDYPRTISSVTLYTLSLDENWIGI